MKQIMPVTITAFCLTLALCLSSCRSATTGPTATPAPTATNERQTQAERPVWTVTEPDPGAPNTALEIDLYAADAPDFPPDLVWLNTDEAAITSLAELRGKVVILMFWSYDCIDCLYNFQDLQQLQADYPDDLAVISVHSTKLESDEALNRVRQTIDNYYQAEFPTINDADQRVWYRWGAQGIPTLIIIDQGGNIFGVHTGEAVYATLKPIVKLLTRGQIN